MRYLPNGKQMSEADAHTIHEIGIPSLVLMERAALQIIETMHKKNISTEKSLIVCGSGNNGGDGFAVARLLTEQGKHADVLFAGKEASLSEECRCQKQIVENMGISVFTEFPDEEYTVIIDAVFGVGLCREITGHYKDVIDWMNLQDAEKVAVDIPSGICATTGKILGTAFRADLTVCMACVKLGCELFPGKSYAGESIPVAIGIDPKYFSNRLDVCYTFDKNDLGKLLPSRMMNSHKGSYGKVLIVAGNETMSGAACFAAEAALRMGAGLVKVLSDVQNRSVLQTKLPEILFGERKDLKESLNWCDCILFGPGIGVSEETKEMLEMILEEGTKPLVIDADGLNTISRYDMEINYPYGLILTPHLMEASRLMACDIMQMKEDLCQNAYELAKKYHCIAVLKDAATIVAQEGDLVYINQSGNDGMATGGSGDVLAGMITGLLGGGLAAHEAAVHGVYLHGLAGDHARCDLGAYSMIASDIITHIKDVTGGSYESVL